MVGEKIKFGKKAKKLICKKKLGGFYRHIKRKTRSKLFPMRGGQGISRRNGGIAAVCGLNENGDFAPQGDSVISGNFGTHGGAEQSFRTSGN